MNADESHQKDEQQQQDASTPTEDLNEPFGEGKKALIVEDDPTTTELIRKLLIERHFDVTQAKNGKDAWDKIRPDYMPDIIISDLVMPEMNGFQLFKGIKEEETTKNIPVIFLTARKNMEDSMLALGVDAFLPKPIDAQILLETTKKLLLRKPIAPKSTEDAAEKPQDESAEKPNDDSAEKSEKK